MHDFEDKTDEQLFLLFQQGEDQAFDVLYLRYWDLLLQQAFFKLQDSLDAEDVVQTVLVNLWKRRQLIQLRHSFKTYIYAAVRYEILNHIYLQIKKPAFDKIESVELHLLPVDDQMSEAFGLQELEERIEKIVHALPERCQIIFRMSREQYKQAKEIAEELNISQRTVETQISKAISKIRKGLNFFILLF